MREKVIEHEAPSEDMVYVITDETVITPNKRKNVEVIEDNKPKKMDK